MVRSGSSVKEKAGSGRCGRVVGACGGLLWIQGDELWRCSHTDLNIVPCMESRYAFWGDRWWLCSVQGVSEAGKIPIRFHCDGSTYRWPIYLVVRMGSCVGGDRGGLVVGFSKGALRIEDLQEESWLCSYEELEALNTALSFEARQGKSLGS